MQDLHFQILTVNDIAAADQLRALAGWNQTEKDWRRFLDLGQAKCFGAFQKETLIGTVSAIAYENDLAWIGMMLVHPDYRRMGIGSGLMRQAIDWIKGRGGQCIKLDATPAGQLVYQTMGFVPETNLRRWQGTEIERQSGSPVRRQSQAQELQKEDWPSILEMDLAAFGVDRSELLQSLVGEARCALVIHNEGGIAALGALRAGSHADYIGPVLGRNKQAGRILIENLLARAGTRLVAWDIPDENSEAQAIACSLGFKPARPFCRMRLGRASFAAQLQLQFAIADPSLG